MLHRDEIEARAKRFYARRAKEVEAKQDLIDHGYLQKSLRPIKCTGCECATLMFTDYTSVEPDKTMCRCTSCGKLLGTAIGGFW